jgi:hypothetical protein
MSRQEKNERLAQQMLDYIEQNDKLIKASSPITVGLLTLSALAMLMLFIDSFI